MTLRLLKMRVAHMKIFVLVKQVPDTETRIKLSGSSIDESGVKWIISPFDENAVEEALRQREKTGATVTALSIGPSRAVEALRNAFALGVDHAVHIKDDAYNTFDVSFTAAVLSKYLVSAGADIIFTGHIAIDSQSAMVPAMIAEHLNIVNINNALEVKLEGDKISVKREIDGGVAVMEAKLPVVISAAKALNEPRYPSLKGIMAAKKKQIDTVDLASLGVTYPRVDLISLELPPPRPPGRTIDAPSPEAKADSLVKALREEAKVI